MKFFLLSLACSWLLIFSVIAQKTPTQNELIEIITRVNTNWQKSHPNPGNPFWDNAAYHTGNMEAYFVTKNEDFRKYSERWAEKNKWQGASSNDKAKWKYTYGEKPEYVLFGDWQICFQTYIDLYNMSPDSVKISRALEVMEYQISTPNNDYWWWVDGLYMVMPVMTKLYKLTGNIQYLDKLTAYFQHAKTVMYDSETGLFYRDAKYVYPKHKSVNSKKDFWSRGNGWVFAGLAKVLDDMSLDYKHRDIFVTNYKLLADAIVSSQQKQGYWTRSLLDPKHAPGYETSGTAFFSYGLLWGINNGLLTGNAYKNAALKSWKYLTKIALQPNGSIGYVQPIGEKAIPGQEVNANSTANFGVGAFLLVSAEMYRYSGMKNVRISPSKK
jgi:rhamnogalacturonyl hydrolase YesR